MRLELANEEVRGTFSCIDRNFLYEILSQKRVALTHPKAEHTGGVVDVEAVNAQC